MNPMVWHASGALPDPMVKRYQDILAYWQSRGLATGPLERDGLLGPHTTAAVRAYQTQSTANGRPLAINGVLDIPTKASLERSVPLAVAAGFLTVTNQDITAGPRVTGSHPVVAAIQTAATPTVPAQVVAVPPQVSQMLPPSTVAQLQTMPAPQVQSFVNDLVRKVATAENTVLSEGTGKDFTAVPVVVDGVVRAAVQSVNLAPVGWWAGLTPNERIGYGVGGAVVGVAVLGGIVYLFRGKDRR